MHRRLWWAVTIWLSASSIGAAQANTKAAPPPPGYSEAVTQALSELEANNYPEARAEFARAHALYPNARTFRGLGMVEFELRHYAESARLLAQALVSNVKPLDDKLRSETQALLERARRYLSDVSIELSPSHAALSVDGASMEWSGGESLVLEVGEHVIEARASGHAPARRTLNVKGGERLSVRMALDALTETKEVATAVMPSQPASSPPADSPQPVYKKWWLWTSLAVVVAGGATAAVLLLSRPPESTTGAPPTTANTPVGGVVQALRSF